MVRWFLRSTLVYISSIPKHIETYHSQQSPAKRLSLFWSSQIIRIRLPPTCPYEEQKPTCFSSKHDSKSHIPQKQLLLPNSNKYARSKVDGTTPIYWVIQGHYLPLETVSISHFDPMNLDILNENLPSHRLILVLVIGGKDITYHTIPKRRQWLYLVYKQYCQLAEKKWLPSPPFKFEPEKISQTPDSLQAWTFWLSPPNLPPPQVKQLPSARSAQNASWLPAICVTSCNSYKRWRMKDF